MNRVEAVPCDSVVHVNNGLPSCLSDRSGNGIIEQPNTFLRLKFNDMISKRYMGIVELDASNLMAIDENGIVVVDTRRKQLLQVDGVDLQQVSHHRIVDLSINGDRWELVVQICHVSRPSLHSVKAARGMRPSAMCFSRVCFSQESLRVDLPSMRSVILNTYAFGEVVDATVHSTLLLFDHPIDTGCLESWLYHPMSLKAKCACL